MKRITSIIVAVLLAMSCLLFTACGSGKSGGSKFVASETYAGTVSEESYTSTEDAAKAFVETEMISASFNAQYKSSEKEADLTETEIEELDLNGIEGNVASVEKWKVAYSEGTKQSPFYAAAGAEDETAEDDLLYVTVYIIVIEISPAGVSVEAVYEYRYYVPLPENGERLSSSYYNSIFDKEKYTNCTMSAKIKISAYGETQDVNETIYFTEDAVKISMTVMGMAASVYCVQAGNEVKCCMEYMGQYEPFDFSDLGMGSLDDLYASQLTDAECAFFVKTDYGFKVDEAMYEDLIISSLGSLGSAFSDMITIDKCKCEYYIADGRIYKSVIELAYTLSFGGDSMSQSTKGVVSYKNFGTTKVSIPGKAKAILGI